MAAAASLEGVELSSENVERAVLQFYHNSATQVRQLESTWKCLLTSVAIKVMSTMEIKCSPWPGARAAGDAQVVDPGPAVAPGMELLLGPHQPGQTPGGDQLPANNGASRSSY